MRAHARRKAQGQDPGGRLGQERGQGARYPRAPWRFAARRERVRPRARHRIERQHGLPPAADADGARLCRAGTQQPRLPARPPDLPDGQRLPAGQRSCRDRAAASRGAARCGRRDRLPRRSSARARSCSCARRTASSRSAPRSARWCASRLTARRPARCCSPASSADDFDKYLERDEAASRSRRRP